MNQTSPFKLKLGHKEGVPEDGLFFGHMFTRLVILIADRKAVILFINSSS